MHEFRVTDINSPSIDIPDSLDTHFREAVKNRQCMMRPNGRRIYLGKPGRLIRIIKGTINPD